ncbi:MAG TPA: TadE/TadG family type IV pilus assembly protein [Caulobacteraceae bacterium]|jgi:Flp pilus assembly protein TadG|nr:TadE/TadG family type IV pilus assembly protein [Caulobacteraceae bacterium]
MTARRITSPTLPRFLSRLARSRDGATAVEFAFVALPFFSIVFAIFQIGTVFLAQQVLQTAVTKSARLIMTGQAQNAAMTSSQFQTDVCNNAKAMFTCSGLKVNVQKFNSFTSVTQLNPLVNGTFNSASLSYNTGGVGDIMMVQVFYQWPVFIGPLGFNMSNMNGNYRLLMGTAVFRNEPF